MSETNRYAEKLNTWMVDEMTLTEGLARDIASLETVTEEEVRRVLFSHFEGRDELLDMYYGTSQGEMWKASAESEIPEGYDPRERGWYKLAQENAGLSVTDPYFDVFTFQMCDTICCPVYKNNQLTGVVGIDISLVTVTEVASSVQYDDGVYLSNAFTEISQDNKEQAENSTEIVCEVGKITDMVSANTATAHQTAVSTEELNEQAKRMKKIVQDFKL